MSQTQDISLVTGGAGFIGSHLVEALLAAGGRVRVLDDLSTGRLSNLNEALNGENCSRLEMTIGSIEDEGLLPRLMRGVKTVYHLAALTAVPESVVNPEKSIRLNDLSVYRLYHSAAEAKVKRVVYASSSAVYGDQPVPHHENLCPRPDTPYAFHKLLGEHYGLFFHNYRGLSSVYLRFFNVYGPRQLPDSPYSGVISLFMDALAKGLASTIFDDGLQTRDFVYVDDVVRALMAAAASPEAAGQAINIGSGQASTIADLSGHLALLAQRPKLAPQYAPARPGDLRHSSGPLIMAEKYLNFKAHIMLAEGLAKTWQWFEFFDQHDCITEAI